MTPSTPGRAFATTFLVLLSSTGVVPTAGAVQAGAVAQSLDESQASKPAQAPQEAAEIIVTGSLQSGGVPVVPLGAVGSRDVLGPEQIERTGARDLNDLLPYLPAISTRPYNGGEAAAPNFSIRGLPDDGLTEYVLPLIDGVPANPLPYGWTALSFFPLMTEQVYAIDLIRGGHAVRYSPNTVGAALNFITRPIPDEPGFRLRSTYGSNDYVSNLLEYGDRQGDFGFLISAGDRRGEGYREDGGFDSQVVDVKLRWQHGFDSWTATRFSFMEDTHQAPGGLTQTEFEQQRFGNARPRNRFDGFRWVADLVRHDETDSGFLEYFTWMSQTRRELEAQRPHFGASTDFLRWSDDSYVAAAGVRGEQRFDWLSNEHTLYWGVRVQEELLPSWEITSEPFGGGPSTQLQDSDYELTAISAHVDDTLEPLEGLTLTAGVRAEWVPVAKGADDVQGGDFDDELFELLPGVGVSYLISDTWALFANYHRSFRAPQVWGFDLTAAAANQNVDFEQGDSFEVGTRVIAPAGIEGSLTGWRTDFNDVGVFYSGTYENIGRIVAEGVDVAVDWSLGELRQELDGLSLRASWTVQDSELREGPSKGNQTPYAWENKAAWSLQYATDDDWRFSLGGVHVGDSFSDEANTEPENPEGNLGRNPGRTLWDAQVEKSWTREQGRFRLAFGATNVFDEDWFVHSRGGFFGGGKVAGPPRQLYVRIGASF